jgi:hypothetical protein
MRRASHRCPVVIVDGLDMSELEEFADYMPEGVTLKTPGSYNAKMTIRHGCLCGVDMDATAAINGYVANESHPGRFTLTPKEAHHAA